jgi:integrase
MARPRTRDRHLPINCYHQHGAYYYVRAQKWHRLGTTLAEAMAAYARLVGVTEHTLPALLADTLTEAAKRQLAASTLHQYRKAAARLSAILIEFSVTEVKPLHVATILDEYSDKPAWANILRTVLKLAMDLAVRRGWIDHNPVISIPRLPQKPRTRYLTDPEYHAIHQHANPTLRAIMALCYLTAQRISDVLKIRESDLTAAGIEFDQEKTDKKLLILWNPDLEAAVRTARALHTNRKIYLLAKRNGELRSYTGVRDLWHHACTQAGIPDAHLHDLRAKSLTDAKKQGLNAQRLAGHSTEGMTNRYLRSRERDEVIGPSFRQSNKIGANSS